MYSILIVDDERYMREGIAKILPWERLNIGWVETAESGTKALKKMEFHMPDIVLTDIEMKNMDGLALIRKMNQINPRLRIIVLTGHDDFSYVRECCRMDVHDYLLKPVDETQLTQVILTQIQALEQSQKRTMEMVSGLTEQLRVEKAFHQFFQQPEDMEQITEILDNYGYQKEELFQAAVIVPSSMVKNEWISHQELLDLSMKSVCVEQIECQRHGITFRDKNGLLVVLLFCGAGQRSLNTLRSCCLHMLNDTYFLWMREIGGSVSQDMVNLLMQIQTADKDAVYRIGRSFLEQLLTDGKDQYENVVASAKQYISLHLDQPLSVAELAGQFYLSVTYFSKLFKKTEGVGCNYYIMCQRMEKAKELLKQDQIRIREAARQVGYKDVNYFSLTFKKYVGVSPAEYREQG